MIDSTKKDVTFTPASGSASTSFSTALRIVGCDGESESSVPIWAPLSFLAASAARHAGQSEATARSVAAAVTSGGNIISKSYEPPRSAKGAKEDVAWQILMASQEASSALKNVGAEPNVVSAVEGDVERAGMLLARMVHSGKVVRVSRFGSGYHVEVKDPHDVKEEDSRDDIEMARSSGSTGPSRVVVDVNSDENLFVRDTVMEAVKPKNKEEIKPKKVPSDQSGSDHSFFVRVMSGLEEASADEGLHKRIPVKRVDNSKLLAAMNRCQDAPKEENSPLKSNPESNLEMLQEMASNKNDTLAPVAIRKTTSDVTVKRTNQEAKKWRAAIDKKSGNTYYYRKETKEVRWEKPLGFDEAQKCRRSRSNSKREDDHSLKGKGSGNAKDNKSSQALGHGGSSSTKEAPHPYAFEQLLAIHGLVQHCSRHLASSSDDGKDSHDQRVSSPSTLSAASSGVLLDRVRGLIADEEAQLDEKRKKRPLFGRITQRLGK